jgi:DNA polymerase III delta prime subunit
MYKKILESALQKYEDSGQIPHSWLFYNYNTSENLANTEISKFVAKLLKSDKQTEEIFQHPNVIKFETNLLQFKVSEVRELLENLYTRNENGLPKIIYISDMSKIKEETTNVLLKSIEEPPENTIWILQAKSLDSLLPTIISRCQKINLGGSKSFIENEDPFLKKTNSLMLEICNSNNSTKGVAVGNFISDYIEKSSKKLLEEFLESENSLAKDDQKRFINAQNQKLLEEVFSLVNQNLGSFPNNANKVLKTKDLLYSNLPLKTKTTALMLAII